MKRATLILAALALLFLGLERAEADVIVGPSAFPIVGGNDTLWGIQFTAVQDSTLTGFDYNHHPDTFGQPFTGTISVIDVTGAPMVDYTNPYGPGAPTVVSFTGLNVSLQAGHNYQLVATSDLVSGANDEVYQYDSLDTPPFSYPVSDSDISVTQGVFDANPGFQEAHGWAAFTNITTAAAVPEPATLALAGIGGLTLLGYGWRRRRAA